MDVFSNKKYLTIVLITCCIAFLIGIVRILRSDKYLLSPPPPVLLSTPVTPPSMTNPKTYTRFETLEKPLILSGSEQLIIEDTQYLAQESITLRDTATLIVRNSFFIHHGKSGKSVSLIATGNSKVIIDNSTLNVPCDESVFWTFENYAELVASTVSSATADCFPLQRFSEKATGQITSWDDSHVAICGESIINLKDSKNSDIDLCFPPAATTSESFPKISTDVYTFPNDKDFGIGFLLTLTNSSIRSWNIYTAPKTDITIHNTHNLNIRIVAGKPWNKKSILLNGLHTGVYIDETIALNDAKLHLLNTTINHFDLSAEHNNRILVRNSSVGNILAKEDSIVIIEKASTAKNIETLDNAEITVQNSTIQNSVSSNDSSKITLVNSIFSAASDGEIFHVPSQTIRARDTSTITLTQTPLKGSIVEEGNGRVVIQ